MSSMQFPSYTEEGSEPPAQLPVVARPQPVARPAVRRRLLLWCAIPALLAVVLEVVFFVPLPSVIHAYGKIAPAHEWILAKGVDGQLIASNFNHQTGLSDGYRVSNFDRGSSVHFSLRPTLAPGQQVAPGDTIGSIISSEMQERLIALGGELAATQKLLAVNASGEKAAIVNEAQQRLQFAVRRKEEHAKVLERATQLMASDLISRGEFERVQNESNSLADAIQIARVNLEAARTGAKPEQLELVHARIAALKNEIATIQRREATYTITSPIAGTISRTFSADTLLRISDTSAFVALMPIRFEDYGRVTATPEPRLSAAGLSAAIPGKLLGVGTDMEMLHGRRVVLATGLFENATGGFLPGMLAKCRIECPRATAFRQAAQRFGGAR